MVDVFISYSRANKDRVAEIAKGIEAAGYEVWWDAELPPHQSYGDVITAKIQMAKAAVVVWSAEAAASEWVRAEADVARNQKKLIQTALGDIAPPLPFNQIQFANLGEWHGDQDHPEWRKVKASLAALCGPPRGAAAAAEPPAYVFPAEAPPGTEGDVAAAPAHKAILPTSAPKPPAPPASAKPAPKAAAAVAPAPVAPATPAGAAHPSPAGPPRSGGVPVPVVIGGLVALVGLAGAGWMLSGSGEDAPTPVISGTPTPGSEDEDKPTDDRPPAEEEDKPTGGAAPALPPVAQQQQQTSASDQYNRDVRLINQTGDVVMYLYWSNTNEQNWGDDQLGQNVLPAGNSWDVTIDDGTGTCDFDIMAVTQGGRQVVHNGVNVCAVTEVYFN